MSVELLAPQLVGDERSVALFRDWVLSAAAQGGSTNGGGVFKQNVFTQRNEALET
ncbi:unnamed protein product, partial [Amoebophrya sp. A25]|eukprot:GSA25T00002813001.1